MLTPSQTGHTSPAARAARAAASTTSLLATLPPWLPEKLANKIPILNNINNNNMGGQQQQPPSPPPINPKSISALSMSFAMALHFFGYEFARGSNMALFTSSSLGFGSSSGKYYPLAMACVSPASMALLLGYGRELEKRGPRKALRNSTVFCCGVLATFGALVAFLQNGGGGSIFNNNISLPFLKGSSLAATTIQQLQLPQKATQIIIALSFIFQNSYAHLLYAQQWSFLGSIFTPTQASQYYSYVAGLSSICSMIAGASIDKCVVYLGLSGLLNVAAFSLVCTAFLADWAYEISERGGFDPSMELLERKRKKEKMEKKKREEEEEQRLKIQQQQQQQQQQEQQQQTQQNETDPSVSKNNNTSTKQSTKKSQSSSSSTLLHQIKQGYTLFQRVPTLGALFLETLSFQSLSTILNTCLVTQLKHAVPEDSKRAAWTGNFYATVNGLSTIFQFLIFPILTRKVEPKVIWRLMPLLPLACTVIQCLESSGMMLFPSAFMSSSDPSSALYLVAISFLTAKTMDYSLRNVLAELVYVPLDFESRYVGKEVIAVFANRFGKSGMALFLSGWQFLQSRLVMGGVGAAAAAAAGGGGGGGLLGIALMASLGWWGSAVRLSSLVLGKEEAEKVVAERLGGDDATNSEEELSNDKIDGKKGRIKEE